MEVAVNYFEEHHCDPITGEDVAKVCCSSLAGLQKLFRYALYHSLKEYIAKRRLNNATRDIAHSNGTVTEIAMRYQYNSSEVFARAFKRLLDVAPSAYKETWRFSGLFPKIEYKYREGDDPEMARKKADISEAYEMFQKMRGTYVVCFDVNGLLPINVIAWDAGDKTILEAARRIECIAFDDMLVLRIGGDEFALVTGKSERRDAESIMGQVLAFNGKPITWNGREIPVSLWEGINHKNPDRQSALQ